MARVMFYTLAQTSPSSLWLLTYLRHFLEKLRIKIRYYALGKHTGTVHLSQRYHRVILVIPYRLFGSGAAAIRVKIEHRENTHVCCGGDEGEIEHIENRNVRLGGEDEGKIEHIENRNIPLGGGAESHRRCTAQTESRIPIFLVPDFSPTWTLSFNLTLFWVRSIPRRKSSCPKPRQTTRLAWMVLGSDLRASKETKVMKDRRKNRMDREQLTYDTISYFYLILSEMSCF